MASKSSFTSANIRKQHRTTPLYGAIAKQCSLDGPKVFHSNQNLKMQKN